MRSKKSQLHPPIPDGGETEKMKTLDKPNFTPVAFKPSFKRMQKKKKISIDQKGKKLNCARN